MNEQDIAKLKAAGFSDADIADYHANTAPEAAQPAETLPEVDVTTQSEISRNAEAAGIPTTNEGSWASNAAAVGAAAAPYAVPVGAGALGIYGAAKVGGWGRNLANTVNEGVAAYKHGVNTANEIAQRNVDLQNQRMAERMARGGGQAAQNVRPVAPNAGAQAFGQMGENLAARGPVVPQGMPAAQAVQAVEQPGIMQRGMDVASKMRQFAANKVMPGLGAVGEAAGSALGTAGRALAPVARVAAGPIGTGLQAMFHSGSTGPQVPQQGPYRGMEINPHSGRPWTPQELALINK
jgi:hypothetical protein